MNLTGMSKSEMQVHLYRFLNSIVPEEDLYDVAISYVRKIAKGPSYAIGLGKELIYRDQELTLETFLQMETIYQVASFTDADFKE